MSEKLEIKPIETMYKGYLFRSRLEARYAVFFDALGIKWEPEHEGFVLPDGTWYLPDFRIKVNCRSINPDEWIYVEIKGVDDYEEISEKDRNKIEQFGFHWGDDEEPHGKPLIVLGNLDSYHSECLCGYAFIDSDWYPANFSYHAGKPWIAGCDHNEYDGGKAEEYAILCAKQARFEHGEVPRFETYKQPEREKDKDLCDDCVRHVLHCIHEIETAAENAPEKDVSGITIGSLYLALMAISEINKKHSLGGWYSKFIEETVNPWIKVCHTYFHGEGDSE